MDFETTEKVAQKPVKSDFEQNVITLPLIHTFERMEDFKEQAKQGAVTREEIDRAVQKAGGLSYTRLIAKKYYTKSLRIINQVEVSTAKREKLLSILEKAYRIF